MKPIYFLKNINYYIRWTIFSILIGTIVGMTSVLFVNSLEWATQLRENNFKIIYGLPIAGFIIGWFFYKYGNEITKGTNLIIDEILDPQKIIPITMAPLIYFSTILTHLFGGSAGREGTLIQIGTSLADQLSPILKLDKRERKVLLTSATCAAFGSALGTPWAGFIFGMEFVNVEKIDFFAIYECLLTAFVGYWASTYFGIKHPQYSIVLVPSLEISKILLVILAGIIFGLVANFFTFVTLRTENLFKKLFNYPPLRPFSGGCILVILFLMEKSHRYIGLGIPAIQNAFINPVSFDQPIYKIIFTSLTIGSGFKGGEFVPLVFIGSTLGSALSQLLPLSFKMLWALGFVSVFAGASNTPLACSILAMELFGIQITPYALIACYSSYFISRNSGIYKSQKMSNGKFNLHTKIQKIFNL